MQDKAQTLVLMWYFWGRGCIQVMRYYGETVILSVIK